MAYHDRAMCRCAPAQAALCVWVVRRAVQIACKTTSLLSFSYVCPKPVLTKQLKRKQNWKRDRFLTEPSLAQPATRDQTDHTTKYLPVRTQRDFICL